ncbi:uncharacterized protein G2W53_025916 [Senna tora]|uniref:Uncharacterized protein n=1 Tax=Senna tora TaxID=362788 RepID=A0A834WIB9_9FABA|nr:uncharacterized protein G2W53_025916 [Senna tora]
MLMRVKKWSKKGERKRKDSRRADAQCARGRGREGGAQI